MSEASLRINESLDFDTVLQEVVDSARTLTGSRYGAITVLGEAGQQPDFIVSGLTREEHQGLWEMPQGLGFFEYLSGMKTPLRVTNIADHLSTLGMPGFSLPVPAFAVLVAPIRHRGVGMGTIYLAHETAGREFSQEDEETLVMFASHAAVGINNARRAQDEHRVRSDLEALINTSPVGVVVFDTQAGALVSHNREADRIIGAVSDTGRPFEERLGELVFRRVNGQELSLGEALQGGETVRAEEIVIAAPDGRSITTLVNTAMNRSLEGEAASLVATVQDMTPLEDQERLRAEFLAMVSHELRRPLAAIKGSAAASLSISSRLDATEMHQFFRIIEGEADQMFEMINDLLDVARIEAGVLMLSVEPTEVAMLIDRARSTMLNGEGKHDIDIDAATDLPRALVDRRRIVQVLGNLLSNAASYSPNSSPIRVAATHEGEHIAISVCDEGVGVAAERLPDLFRKFPRLDADESSGMGMGQGLGLAICKDLVEAHGGRIWAQSDGPGRGTRFTFTIPVAEEASTAPAQVPTPFDQPGHGETQRARILAIDDDPLALRFARDALSDAGYTVIVADAPVDALRLMRTEMPHLVLLDLMLPQADGVELMGDLKAIADIPVIFLSGYNRDTMIDKAFDMGADDYIVKPFSPAELTARVRTAIRRRLAAPTYPREPYVQGDLRIDYAERQVSLAGRPLELTATERDLLIVLAANAGQVLTHQQILTAVWGHYHRGGAQTIRTTLMRLRRKLDEDAADPKYIFSEPRKGYRMAKPEPAPGPGPA